MTKIAIIIVNYHGEKDTQELLESLSHIQKDDIEVEVIIVDNGSKSEQINCPENLSPIIIRNNTNVGFAKANNQGINYGIKHGADYVCLLNNDTTVSPNFLIELLKIARSNKYVGIVSPKIYFSAGREFHKNRYKTEDLGKVIWYAGGILDLKNVYGSHRGVDEVDVGQYDKTQITDFATGCCFLIKKEVVEKVGLLDEKYFAYLEDVDYCMRAKKAGYQIYYQPQSVIWHKNASSSGGAGSKLHFFLQERNRIYFGLRYASLKTKVHLLIKALKYLFSFNYKICLSLIKMFI